MNNVNSNVNMKPVFALAGAFALASMASLRGGGAEFTSPDILKVASGDANVRIAPVTVSAEEVLKDLPTPIFHFDATDTANWKFTSDRTSVTNIPSTVGTRYLANTLDGGPSEFLGNGTLEAPNFLDSVPELGGRPAVDFGDACNTQRSLWFNPVVPDGAATDCVASNLLSGIGSVVAVHKVLHDSVNTFFGGGWVKGSPAMADDTAALNNNWKRGTDSAERSLEAYWTPMVVGYRGPLAASKAWHNGQVTGASNAGFTPGWDVTVFQPTGAVFQATGLGQSTVPSPWYNRGGGQWAELYVFGEVVDEDVLMRLQAYLRAKWLGAATVGYDGSASVGCVRTRLDAHTQYGVTNEIETAAGQTLQIDRLSGGRGYGAATVKKGEGTLRILDAANYGGDLVLSGGRLDLAKRVTPTVDDLPGDLTFRFDASVADSLVSNTSDDYVLRWRNLTDFKVKDATVYAQATGAADAARPWILHDALNGLDVLDFGSYTTANKTKDGREMEFAYSADGTTFTAFSPASVYTVVAVIGAQRSGGNIVANANASVFARIQTKVDWMTDVDFDQPLLRTDPVGSTGYASVYPVTNAIVMLDGVKVDSQAGYATPGYQVVAIRAAGSTIRYIGGTNVRKGGLRLGELLVWKRPLSETEVRDAEAYLTKKWFGRELPGYQAASVTLPDVRAVTVAAESEIYVPSGTVARIDGLVANAPVKKTGAGTLQVGPFGADGGGTIRVCEGTVASGAASDVADKATPAAGASLHLDASDAASIQFADGSESTVWYWHDKENRNVAYNMTEKWQPFLNTTDTQNGLPVMDFSTAYNVGDTDDGRTLDLARPLDGVRSAFVVWYPRHGGTILGSSSKREKNDYSIDYARASDGDGFVVYNSGAQPVRDGEIRVDGQVVSVDAAITNGEFHLYELHPAAATSVSALASDRGKRGGGRYGEILLYERELTAREKTATRNYLMKKWFGKADDELENLPDAPDASIPGSLAFADGATWNISVGADGQAATLSVTGTLSFGTGLTVNFDGLPTDGSLHDLRLTVATAGGFENVDALAAATFTGHAFDTGTRPRFLVRSGGKLDVRFGQRGMLLIVR